MTASPPVRRDDPERVDVIQVRGRGVRTATGATVALVNGRSPQVTVEDPVGESLLRVDKRLLDEWYARTPAGEAILRIDQSLNRFHTVTYADGRTGQFDAAPKFGAWELTGGGRLLVHAQFVGGPVTGRFEWECAQDGSLSLLDFLATVITYRELCRLRRQHLDAAGALS